MMLQLTGQPFDTRPADGTTAAFRTAAFGENPVGGSTSARAYRRTSTRPGPARLTRGPFPVFLVRCVRWMAVLLVGGCIWTGIAEAASPAEDVVEQPIQHRPYRVEVAVTFGPSPRFTAGRRGRFVETLHRALLRTWGPMCDLEESSGVHEIHWLSPSSRVGLERLAGENEDGRLAENDLDKTFFLVVESSGSRLAVSGREWDRIRGTLGPVHTEYTYNEAELSDVAVRLILSQFQPVLVIDTTDVGKRTAALRLQAGALPPFDPQSTQLEPGDVLQPLLRYLDRDREVRRIQLLPWTYLVVDSIDAGFVECSLVSGLRSPLGARRQRRVETWAVRIRPRLEETRLEFQLAGPAGRPMIGHEVQVAAKTFFQDDAQGELLNRVIDRHGGIHVPVNSQQPIVWLYVHSGESLVARVPYVPGVVPSERFQLPDDSLRLSVEGELDLLKGKLIDTVARRATLSSRALRLAKDGRMRAVPSLTREIDALPGAVQFESELTAIRVPALEEAARRRDRQAEVRIRRICDQTSQLIQHYLDDDKIRRLKEVLNELRTVDQR